MFIHGADIVSHRAYKHNHSHINMSKDQEVHASRRLTPTS